MELDRERVDKEIKSAINYLKGIAQVKPKKIGVVGWCMGGSLTYSSVANSQDVGAAVAFYGVPRDLGIIQNIRAPFLGHYGKEDQGISVDMLNKINQEFDKSSTLHKIHIYQNAGHAFFNDTRPHAYDPNSARDAWDRTLAWLREYLV
jgi:carboxymethylenebutenolidase